jgi:hypothetical protein
MRTIISEEWMVQRRAFMILSRLARIALALRLQRLHRLFCFAATDCFNRADREFDHWRLQCPPFGNS